jgi:chemotaxis protein CheZ
MVAQRKVFRIEEMVAAPLAAAADDAQPPLRHAELMAELAGLRGAVTALAQSGSPAARRGAETARLKCELDLIAGAIAGAAGGAGGSPGAAPMTRIARELEEVLSSSEAATQKVLAAAEEVDQVAHNLSAALTGKFEQGLAQDILDLVIRIFEACNFQDVAGQRISKVLATFKFLEDHISRVLAEINNAAGPPRNGMLHGPRLEIDTGHVSQAEIDSMFADRASPCVHGRTCSGDLGFDGTDIPSESRSPGQARR